MEKVIKINGDNLAALKNKRSDHSKYLNDLIVSLRTCSETYNKLAKESNLPELKEIASRLASERAEFVLILKDGFRDKARGNFSTLNKIKPLWLNLVKSVVHSKDDQTIINAILKNEHNAAKKYNTYLYNHIPTVEQLNRLLEQKRAVNEAIQFFRADHNLHSYEISLLTTKVA